jgi:hypothetical protein
VLRYVLVSTCIVFSYLILFTFPILCFFLLRPSKIGSSVCGFRHFCGKDNAIVMLLLLVIFIPAFLFLNCQSIQNLTDNTHASLLIMCQVSLVWSKRLHLKAIMYLIVRSAL